MGLAKVNLIDYIEKSNGSEDKSGVPQQLNLEKCNDQNANIQFTIRSVYVSTSSSVSDATSMGSGTISLDSVPKSEFDFGDFEGNKASRLNLRDRLA